jgi:hypothetical protein
MLLAECKAQVNTPLNPYPHMHEVVLWSLFSVRVGLGLQKLTVCTSAGRPRQGFIPVTAAHLNPGQSPQTTGTTHVSCCQPQGFAQDR